MLGGKGILIVWFFEISYFVFNDEISKFGYLFNWYYIWGELVLLGFKNCVVEVYYVVSEENRWDLCLGGFSIKVKFWEY